MSPSEPNPGPPLRCRRKTGFYIGEHRYWLGCYLTLDGRFQTDKIWKGPWELAVVHGSPTKAEDAALLHSSGLAKAQFPTRRAAFAALKLVAYDV